MPLISAVDITLSKESYQPEETLQVEIIGNFITLKEENIQIYEQEIPRQEPIIKGLTKYGDTYYFYAILPNREGNFSLRIKGTQYTQRGKLITDTISKNFTIQLTNESGLSINPGFILAKEDFEVHVKSLYGNPEVVLELEATGESKNLSLIEYVDKKVEFSTNNVNVSKTNLKINDYNIPVFLLVKQNISETPVQKSTELEVIPSKLEAKVVPGDNYFFEVYLENIGDKNISDISLEPSTSLITIRPSSIGSLDVDEKALFNLTITVPSTAAERMSEEITIEFEDESITIPIVFDIIEKEEEIELIGTSITEILSCHDIGLICPEDTSCEGEITASLEGSCCIGECTSPKKSRFSWLFGLILLLVVLALAGFIYWRVRKKQKPKSTEEILREKSRQYRERMEKPGTETRGYLKRT
jgi:hypothetical protein